MLLAILVAGCGGNSTTVGITISSSGASPMTILVNTSAQFSASVTGVSATTVFWQICKPTTPPSTTIAPTDCTQGVGPSQCTLIPTVSSPLIGFGTMTPNGLYTAPPSPPQPDSFDIVATSCVRSTAFSTFTVIISSGITVKISPSPATMGTSETLQFTATVSGTTNSSVAWSVCQSGNGGLINCTQSGVNGALGMITSGGDYTAPTTAQSVVIQAISGADQNQSGTASVAVVAATPPTLVAPPAVPIDPTTAAAGSVQQDVYLTGTNFLTTTSVVVGPTCIPPTSVSCVTLPSANVVLLSSTLLRATIPAAQLAQAGTLYVGVLGQGQNEAALTSLNVVTVRPALVGSSPDSVAQSNVSSPNVILTGGYFSPSGISNGMPFGTTVTFNGLAVSQCPTAAAFNSRQMCVSISAGNVGTPGLYPIIAQNNEIPATNLLISALNLGVTPDAASIPGAQTEKISVGSNPSAVAIDEVDGYAVVANTGSNSVSIVNLTTSPPSLLTTITTNIGNQPTGVAVDDLLPDPIALVVNSTDQTVSAVDLSTKAVIGVVSVSIGPTATSPVPFSIGINPLTHRAIVTYQSTNQATVLDLSTGLPVVVQQIGGSLAPLGTGTNPAVAIDPRLNWAIVTPGGAGAISLVDLGFNPSAGIPSGRAPQVVGSLLISNTVQGVAINSETHQALLSDPQSGTLTTFSLLDNTVNTVLSSGVAFDNTGFGAAGASQLENVGIAVSQTPTPGGASAVVVDLESGVVLQTVGGFATGANLQAVAVNPVSNQAVAVDQANGAVYIVSLGTTINPLQIVEASPAIVFGGPGTSSLTLKITGSGFVGGSQVLLDGSSTGITINSVSANGRQIIATVLGTMLTEPHRYIVQVENPPSSFSNVTDLAVIQAVPVGNAPVGVAIDTDRDLAVVTNSADGTASLVALTPETPAGMTQAPWGKISQIAAITVGTAPEGVAVSPRLGVALVANNGSNDISAVDETQTNIYQASVPCPTGCTGPTSLAIDQDTATGVVTNTNPGSPTSDGSVSFVSLTPLTALPPAAQVTATTGPDIDHDPVAVAIDPNPLLPYAGVATDSSASSVEFLNVPAGGTFAGRASGLQNPGGIVFDPVNQVFLVTNTLVNEVVIIDPATAIQTPISVGIGPASLDYNFQTSTLVTVNSISNSMSVMAYLCPPSLAAPSCVGPQVRTILGLGGTQTSAPVTGPNAVAIDPKLNLAVLVDEDNNQILVVPLPH